MQLRRSGATPEDLMMELRGVEPLTPCLQSRCDQEPCYVPRPLT